MNLDELRSAQAKERRKDSLQHLRDSFYDDVAAYVADLRAARDRRAEQVAKPFSDDDVRRLSDEVETAEEVAEALYERRVGKVVKLASFAAADMSVDADGMTTEERRLFDDLVDRIGENKSRVLDVLSGEAPAGGAESASAAESDSVPDVDETAGAKRPAADVEADPQTESTPPAPDPGPSDRPAPAERADSTEDDAAEGGADEVVDALAGAMGGADDEAAAASDAAGEGATAESVTTDGGPTAVPPGPAPPDATGVDDRDDASDGDADRVASASPEATSGVDDRATVRITRDVGAIFGVDEREYDLASEDVVTLPVENAEPLVQRDAAERLD
ncbi:hypothetical protein U4E84_13395 [Halorubrum sp. AD140]|uniref:DNA replication complex subunit Gins51 n=1 Tax=Halorubrum sp. AD140 TaxID=3050073 RepID=UPI002ACC5497|nr:hypothetical protein [Halorubrum sp. AD140]MDZ5812338.1 hypothetical protein [Halorubrum sp. AD140]